MWVKQVCVSLSCESKRPHKIKRPWLSTAHNKGSRRGTPRPHVSQLHSLGNSRVCWWTRTKNALFGKYSLPTPPWVFGMNGTTVTALFLDLPDEAGAQTNDTDTLVLCVYLCVPFCPSQVCGPDPVLADRIVVWFPTNIFYFLPLPSIFLFLKKKSHSTVLSKLKIVFLFPSSPGSVFPWVFSSSKSLWS